MTTNVKRTIMVLGAVAALGAGGAAVAGAAGGEDAGEVERAISGPALERASKAALAHTGGGRVTDTEAGDEEGAYEVEVTRDGREVDVHLDEAFRVLGDEPEGDERDDD